MTLIDFLGEAALFTMDTLYRSGENGLVGQMTQDEIRTVILSMHDDWSYIERAMQAGVYGYVLKQEDFPEMCKAIRLAAQGEKEPAPVVTVDIESGKTKRRLLQLYHRTAFSAAVADRLHDSAAAAGERGA